MKMKIFLFVLLLPLLLVAEPPRGEMMRGEGGHSYEKNPHYRPYYPPAPHHRPGYFVDTLPRVSLRIVWGNLAFFFADGAFYRPYNGRYIVAEPPYGAIVPRLPAGHSSLFIGGERYFVYEGIYYAWDGSASGYRVVDSASLGERSASASVSISGSGYRLGDIVELLPSGAVSTVIDGAQYYRFEGLYFMPSVRNGRVVYIVVNP